MKILEYPNKIIERGMILRCKGSYPYESLVDFLVCEPFCYEDDKDGYMLVVCSGYKAGLKFCQFPNSSLPKEYPMGIDKDWLINNWSTYGYFDCKIEDVEILENRKLNN